MHDTSNKYLLQIHPKNERSEKPVIDELVKKMEYLLEHSKEGTHFRGWHNCTGCGKPSGSCDLLVNGFITNSLAVHYLKWHRTDVPKSEIEKLKLL